MTDTGHKPKTTSPQNASNDPQPNAAVIIKKYANRRLYNTASSAYVTHENLCQMVKEGIDFVVYDARTNEDITRSVLTQIIVDEESKGQNLLPVSFLRQLISFYGDSMQWLVPSYLESTMHSFTHNQDKMRQYLTDAFGGLFSFNSFESMTKQNMAMVENAMKLFSPAFPGLDKFSPFDASLLTPMARMNTTEPKETEKSASPKTGTEAQPALSAANLEQLQIQLGDLQRQVDLMLKANAQTKQDGKAGGKIQDAAPHPSHASSSPSSPGANRHKG